MDFLIGYLIGYVLFVLIGIVCLFHEKAPINALPLVVLFTFLWPLTAVGFYITGIVDMIEKGEFK